MRAIPFAFLLVTSASAQTLSLRSPEIDGGHQEWRMGQGGEGAQISQPGYAMPGWQRAIVPGTVLNSLVANRVYPEPYFGLNNLYERKLIPDLADVGPDHYTYWFRTEFSVPREFRGKQVTLQFDGINYRAEIWLNGEKLGDMAGMFRRGRFDATPYLKPDGPNVLAVRVRPPDVPGGLRARSDSPRAPGENRNGGDGAFGKNVTMLQSVGWDFTFSDGIRDRNTGIWRDVKLVATGPVAVRNPLVRSKIDFPSAATARETVVLEAENLTDAPQRATVRIAIPQAKVNLTKEILLAPKETQEVTFTPEEFPTLIVKSPRLWWPMNKGEAYLYRLEAEARVGRKVSDRLQTRFGIREITSNRDTPDKSRLFYVNGKRFFVRGSNWISEGMLRNSDARTEAELRYTAQSGINFLRHWGGGITESDRFYELCDELGIIVWTEFWQTGDTAKPADAELYRANVEDTVKRIRIHASNGYYVSANERNDVVPIKDLLDRLDGTSGYQVQSEVDGIHDGSPYKYVNPMAYYDDTASPRGSRINGFCPEYGTPCLPTVEALREMMPSRALWPIDKATWDYLDGNGFHLMATDYARGVDQYGPSQSIEEFARKAQAVGAVGYRGIWENWNANRYDFGERFCSGVLFWYHNSPVRQVAGRMWDWSLEPTAALYFNQDAMEPIHAQFHFLKNTVTVNNELMTPLKGIWVRTRVFDMDMSLRLDQREVLDVPADGVAADAFKVALPANLSPVHFIRLDVMDAQGRPISNTFYWRSNQAYQGPKTWSGPLYGGFEALGSLPPATVEMAATEGKKGDRPLWTVRLANKGKTLAFTLQAKMVDAATGKPLRPSFYSDNFISLLPGETRTITIEAPKGAKGRVELDGWNLPGTASLQRGSGTKDSR
jgi:hypothetical protein